MYADYDFYTDDFYGVVISEDDFPRLASKASDFIDYYTKDKAATATDETIVLAIRKACCAVAEKMLDVEQAQKLRAKYVSGELTDTGVKSETVGSWSRSYATAADYVNSGATSDPRAEYAKIALEYLVNTGLLYRGGCSC